MVASSKVSLKSERGYNRLYDAVDESRRMLEPYRRNRYNAIEQFVGQNYSDDGTEYPVYVNMIEQAVSIHVRQLAAKAPQALITTPHKDLKPAAYELQLATNHMMNQMKLIHSLREMVKEALFGVGIMKLGMCVDETSSTNHLGGNYYADIVTLDDWVQDMTAARYDQCGFMGNRFRMRLDVAKDFKGFSKKRREELQPTNRPTQNEGGDYRAENIGAGPEYANQEWADFVDLYELFIPSEKLIMVCEASDATALSSLTGKPLAMYEWTGPRRGPYHQLIFNSVPGNAIGLSKTASWLSMHMLINELARKLAHQAKRQKAVLAYTGESTEEADRVVNSLDGQSIKIDNPAGLNAMEFGGINQMNMGFMLQLKDLFSAHAGNLDVMGGLSPQADTLGQERLMSESASAQIDDMQDQVIQVTTEITQDLAEYLYYDPLISIPITKRVTGTDYSITKTWPIDKGTDLRDGQFIKYNFNIRPYSMSHQTPMSKLQTMSQFFQQFVIPNMPLLEQQGISINFETMFKAIAELTNMDELNEMLVFLGQPTQEERGPVTPAMSAPPQNKTTTSVRVNRPGATNQGKGQIMQNLMFGGQPQQSELASLGRPTG